ncbi:MAG: glycosyl hydrolase-related protein, partial [Atopostipes sp.]|nr:glycosyl hydrolase-related protein [Atopostipes sp.]
INVELYVEDMPAFSWETFYLVPAEEQIEAEQADDLVLENEFLHVSLNENGTLKVHDLEHNKIYDNLLVFEDLGDIGNEYVYKKPNGEEAILSTNHLSDAKIGSINAFEKELVLTHEIEVPLSADEQLDLEQRKVVEFRNRKAQRVEETKTLEIETTVRLEKEANHLEFSTKLTNEMKDHRLRVLFPSSLSSDVHYADSIYETVERPNAVSDVWTNPENPQRTHRFVQVTDGEHGMLVEPDGLNEYEVITEDEGDLTIAVTLFRSIGEMGDWGYFPTPGAQCLDRDFEFVYSLSFHGKEDMEESRKEAIYRHIPLMVSQTDRHEGTLENTGQHLNIEGETVAVTAVKRHRLTDELITRFYNFSDQESEFLAEYSGLEPMKTTILEREEKPLDDFKAKAFEIVTLKWKEGE